MSSWSILLKTVHFSDFHNLSMWVKETNLLDIRFSKVLFISSVCIGILLNKHHSCLSELSATTELRFDEEHVQKEEEKLPSRCEYHRHDERKEQFFQLTLSIRLLSLCYKTCGFSMKCCFYVSAPKLLVTSSAKQYTARAEACLALMMRYNWGASRTALITLYTMR